MILIAGSIFTRFSGFGSPPGFLRADLRTWTAACGCLALAFAIASQTRKEQLDDLTLQEQEESETLKCKILYGFGGAAAANCYF